MMCQQRRRPDDGVQHDNDDCEDDSEQDGITSNDHHLPDVNKFDVYF